MSSLAQEAECCRGEGRSVERVPGKGWAQTAGLGFVGDASCCGKLTQWNAMRLAPLDEVSLAPEQG